MPKEGVLRCPTCNDRRLRIKDISEEKGNVFGYPEDFDKDNEKKSVLDDYEKFYD